MLTGTSLKILFCWLGLLGTLAGCNAIPTASVADSAKTKTELTSSSANIPTKSFKPTMIKITLADLPEPYATESASNSPKVLPVSDNPVLQVPQGFKVNVFADNLADVRWLTLTPDGDVLAVQSKRDRISLLQDKNNDGVAEVN